MIFLSQIRLLDLIKKSRLVPALFKPALALILIFKQQGKSKLCVGLFNPDRDFRGML